MPKRPQNFPILLLAAIALQACGNPAKPSAPTPTPVPTPTPQNRVFSLDFETLPSIPEAFVNVRDEFPAETYPWLIPGIWSVEVVSLGNLKSRVLRQSEVREPSLSFLRFREDLWDRHDGELPGKYRVEVTTQPVRSPYLYPPTGDQGFPFFYVDPTHYLEVVMKPESIEAWECQGGIPGDGKDWNKLWEKSDLKTAAGQLRRLGAEVDVENGDFSVLLDGEKLFTRHLPTLAENKKRYFALRAIGNEVNFDDLRIENLELQRP